MRRQIFLLVVFVAGLVPSFGATFVWDPSPDAATPGKITGYKVYYSSQSFTSIPADVATNPAFTILSVGNQTNAIVNTLVDGQTYFFAVTAVDSQGQESAPSNVLPFTPGAASTPTVALVSPANGGSFITTDVISLAANVTGFSVAIAKVEFFDGAALMSSQTASPYTFATPFAVGSHSLTARATDINGAVVTSPAVNITVNLPPNVSPSIALNSPANGSSFFTNEVVTFSATASDSDGTITKVEFYDGSTILGSKTAPPYSITSAALAQGTHSITAKATDDRGAVVVSAVANITIKVNQPPTVSMTSPAANASFFTNEVVTLSATASDSDGSISKVEFFDGATSLGSKTASPYTVTVSTLPAGSHSITAKATDNLSGVTTSTATPITIKVNQAPTVALTSPANNTSFFTNEVVTLTATASDTDGTISKVEFFDGATLLGSKTASPYTLGVTNLAAGSHPITAKVTDDKSATATSAATTITIKVNQAPTVALTSPANNSSFFTNDVVTITATASDTDGTITQVEFFDGATSLGSKTASPYTVNSSTLTAGNHSITAKATDDKGGSTTSAATTITIKQNQAPTVALTSPASNASFFTNEVVTISANAADSDGTIAKVEFFDGATLLGSDTSSPYTVTVSTLSAGSHTITAKATDDKTSATTSSPTTITIKVNQAPTVALTAPAAASSFFTNEVVTITANASDSDGNIAKVEFFDGGTLLGSDTASPYTMTISTLAAGSHSLTAKATDDKGAATTSTANSITIKVNQAPTVAITSPAANSSFFTNEVVTITATASDSDGTVTKVEFFDAGSLLGSATAPPFSVAVSTLPSGSRSITAKATDDRGVATTSASVTIVIKLNQAPTVAMTSPAANSSFFTNEVVTIAASASDSDGTISKVEFFDGGALIGSKTATPYSMSISTLASGSHTITAKATDDKGSTTTSEAASITIKINQAPTVALTSPAASSSFFTNEVVTISANASDTDGTIAKVEFFDGAASLGVRTASPYSVSVSTLAAGSHTLTAVATDDKGTATTSPATSITIKVNQPPTVALTSPAANSSFFTNEVVTLSASASDADGAVAKVEFFDGASLIGSMTAAPFTLSVSTLSAGSHSITAKVTDDKGATASSPATTITIKVNQPPTVALTSPAGNSTFLTNDLVTFTASATDSDGAVAKVEFFDGATSLGSATSPPYTVSSSTLTAGAHTITARATDDRGTVETSAPATITININQAPTVALSSPAVNASFYTNEVVTISANASDSDGTITKVEFFDGAALLGSATASPFTISVSTLGQGTHTLTAKATDNKSATTVSSPTSISIKINQAPTVALNSPAANASFFTNEVVTIAATATDTDGVISKVEFFDGATLLSSKTSSPYSMTTSALSVGSHTITAKATDDKGATTTSTPSAITIKVNQGPTVALTSPANSSSFFTNEVVTISASASDSDGAILQVDFFDGATLLGSRTAAPFTLTTSTLALGAHSITAKATDNNSASTTSSAISITIKVNQAPTIVLTSPANSSAFGTNDVITINANATDSDGSIAQVAFFDGSTQLGIKTAAPFSLSAGPLSQGTHTITAKATDNKGAVTTSAAVAISVKKASGKPGTSAADVPPTIQLVNVIENSFIPQPVVLQASATDADGTITTVEFFAGDISLGISTNAPFSISAPLPSGTYNFFAMATDSSGAVAASVPIRATVRPKSPLSLAINNGALTAQGK